MNAPISCAFVTVISLVNLVDSVYRVYVRRSDGASTRRELQGSCPSYLAVRGHPFGAVGLAKRDSHSAANRPSDLSRKAQASEASNDEGGNFFAGTPPSSFSTITLVEGDPMLDRWFATDYP